MRADPGMSGGLNILVKERIKQCLRMIAYSKETRQQAALRLWRDRMRFWWKLRHAANRTVISMLVDLHRHPHGPRDPLAVSA